MNRKSKIHNKWLNVDWEKRVRGKVIGSAFFLILGLGFVAFGVFGLANLNNIVKVGDIYLNFEDSFWMLLAVIAAGAIFCYWGFTIWRGSK